MKRILCLMIALGVFSFELAAATSANKLSPDLQNLPPAKKVNVIIQFNIPATGATSAITAQGAALNKAFKHLNGAVFTLPAGILNIIAKLPFVKYISLTGR